VQQFNALKPGDSVEIIAPASRSTDLQLSKIKTLLESWELKCIVSKEIFGNDLLCANTDKIRLKLLISALENPDTKAVICVRGGYGSMRLIPSLAKIIPPSFKIFVGMSDITSLHLFFDKHWHWPTIHGSFTEDKVSPDSIARLKSILFKENNNIRLVGVPLNDLARNEQLIEGKLIGGNLCLVQSSIGTLWQLDGNDKIILLEEIGERGYKVDRMLEHLRQANILTSAKAIIIGDFLEGFEPDGSSLINQVLERFANECKIPVIKIAGIGHGYNNIPIVLGTKIRLKLGNQIELLC